MSGHQRQQDGDHLQRRQHRPATPGGGYSLGELEGGRNHIWHLKPTEFVSLQETEAKTAIKADISLHLSAVTYSY